MIVRFRSIYSGEYTKYKALELGSIEKAGKVLQEYGNTWKLHMRTSSPAHHQAAATARSSKINATSARVAGSSIPVGALLWFENDENCKTGSPCVELSSDGEVAERKVSVPKRVLPLPHTVLLMKIAAAATRHLREGVILMVFSGIK